MSPLRAHENTKKRSTASGTSRTAELSPLRILPTNSTLRGRSECTEFGIDGAYGNTSDIVRKGIAKARALNA